VSPGPMAEKIGKYEVIDQIGRGGMGTIFRALDPILQRSVALKVISNLEVTPELRTRFFREAQACARITHPNIVIIHDMGEDKGQLFIVMELLEGEELRHVIARHADLTLKDKLDIVRQICDGLHYAHQKGVVHRDVKPANILLLRTGQVKILDFGIAQITGAARRIAAPTSSRSPQCPTSS
jgi:eukaryotic-like serine/threonine-protein kinase